MKKFGIAFGLLAVTFIVIFLYVLRIDEWLDLTKNTIVINDSAIVDTNNIKLLYIKEKVNRPHKSRRPADFYDTIFIYSSGIQLQSTFPDSYGANGFLVQYKDKLMQLNGEFKKRAWHKTHVCFRISQSKDSMYINVRQSQRLNSDMEMKYALPIK